MVTDKDREFRFSLVAPPGEPSYVEIDIRNFSALGDRRTERLYTSEKIHFVYDTKTRLFSFDRANEPKLQFTLSQVKNTALTTDEALFDLLTSYFGSEPTVNVSVPNPLPITGNVDVDNFPAEFGVVNGSTPLHVTVDSVSPNPLPVTGTINVGNWPSPFNVAVSNFPATYPVTGTVSVSNFPAIQTVNGVVSTLQSWVLLKRFPLLLNVPQLVKVGATEIFYVKVINSGGTGARQYVKLCDTVAAPTVGVTPVLSTFDGPANATNFVHYIDTPINAVNGIWVYSVRGILDSDATAPASGCICEIGYR